MIEIDKNEHVVFEVRKHWLVFASEIFTLAILALVPLIVASFISNINVDFSAVLASIDLISLFSFFYSLWLLVLWVLGFIFWTSYYLDVWIITNNRIIDVEQKGLFTREVSILHLEKIQDITYSTEGPMQTFFDYGNIEVQTAGFSGTFPINGVPNPSKVQTKINEAILLHNKKID
jgi:membrane protein YdbS with pleckstrin-like domain